MTEAQNVEGLEAVDPSTSPGEQARPLLSRRVEVDGRTWTIVDLEDGLSWDLYAGDAPDLKRAPRLAHITISERGYFSTDVPGVVRGPYPTLDEAAYPIAFGDQILLGDPVDPVEPLAPVGVGRDVSPGRSRLRSTAQVGVLALVASGLAVLVWRVVVRSRAGADLRGSVEITRAGLLSPRPLVVSQIAVDPSTRTPIARPRATRIRVR